MNRNWDEVDRKSTHLGEIIAAKNIRGGGVVVVLMLLVPVRFICNGILHYCFIF